MDAGMVCKIMNPLYELEFPVYCASCKQGPFQNEIEVDEHITEEHLPEAIWDFACANMKGTQSKKALIGVIRNWFGKKR